MKNTVTMHVLLSRCLVIDYIAKYNTRRLRMIRFVFLVPIILMSCGVRSTAPNINFNSDPIVIFNDIGGDPYEYARIWDRLAKTGKQVQLGECNSACTMFLSLPNMCMLPGRRFGFHAPSGPVSDKFIAGFLPGALRQEYLAIWSRSRSIMRFTAEELKFKEPRLKICN